VPQNAASAAIELSRPVRFQRLWRSVCFNEIVADNIVEEARVVTNDTNDAKEYQTKPMLAKVS
jgi:hypothetical protein